MAVGRDVQHPNLVRVYGYGQRHQVPYIVMELLNGQTLEERLKQGPLSLGEALRIFIQVGEGVGFAHQHGIIHRDLKPENIMIEPDGLVRIMDFGIARHLNQKKLTMSGAALGTPLYMSPEHVESSKVDARSDIYSLGVILFEMLAGHPPFTGESTIAMISAHLRKPPPRCDSRT